MRRFDQFILSLTAPEEGNVLWIDTSLDPPTIKVFTNGEWEPVVVNGKSAYELYLDVTADNPPLTLEQFTMAQSSAAALINDNTISTTEVWSSSKTSEEINKLLPLIYAGL